MSFLFVKKVPFTPGSNSVPKGIAPWFLLFFLIFFPAGVSSVGPVLEDFSGASGPDGIPVGWKPLEFPKIKRHTVYTVESDGTNSFLKATSSNSASGIYKEVDIDLSEHPMLRWRWKVEGVVEKGDARKKDGDDYAARIYVTFDYDPERTPFFERLKYKVVKAIYGKVPANAINYIWANKLRKGEHIPNAFTDKAIMIAVESGPELSGRWVPEKRNVYEDYRVLFGAEPPGATGIAVMTDTDNTGESAVAYYDDISLNRLGE
jgi:hypothetical protein